MWEVKGWIHMRDSLTDRRPRETDKTFMSAA